MGGNGNGATAISANGYEWMPAAGLSNNTIANPIASLQSFAQNKFICKDGVGGFTDSARAKFLIVKEK